MGRRLRRRLARCFPPGVYVFAYHSVPDRQSHEPWEGAYEGVRTWLDVFAAQIELIVGSMEPLPLAAVPDALEAGPDRAYAVLTFDDAYANLARGAATVCEQAGFRPTLFTSADFCAGRAVYHRVLLAVLEAEGRGREAAEVLSRRLGVALGERDLLSAAKEHYAHATTEDAVREVWEACHPSEPPPQAHLTFGELRALAGRGWSFGNHTLSHATLARLEPKELDRELLGNAQQLEVEKLAPLPWVAYPNGGARHVDLRVKEWLDRHSELHCLFAGGGVNFTPFRTEGLRIPVGNESPGRFARTIWANVEATREALARVRR